MKKVFSLVVVIFCLVGSVWGQTVSTQVTNATCYGVSNGKVTATISGLTGPYDVYLIRGTGVPPLGYTDMIQGTTESVVTFENVPVNNSYNVQVKIGATIKAFATNINVGQPSQFKESTAPEPISGDCGELGYISAEYSGGTTDYTFTLTSNNGYNKTITQTSGNVLFEDLPEGTYTFTANDLYGCREYKSDDLIIISPAAIVGEVVAGSIVPVKCNGDKTGEVTINTQEGMAPFYYYLDGLLYDVNSTGTLIVNELYGGLHIVTVLDANGCYVDIGFDIPEPTTPLVISRIDHTDVTCGVSTGTITVTASGGTGSLLYSLDGETPQPSNVFPNLPAGDYTIIVTDENGCSKTGTATIKDIPLKVTIVVDENVLCKEAATGKAHVTVSGGDNSSIVQYTWTGPAGFLGGNTASISNAKAGTYTVKVKNANGCEATATGIIDEPLTKLAVTTTVIKDNQCFGDAIGEAEALPTGGTVTGTGTDKYTYSWNSTPVQTTKVATGLIGGVYTVTVTDENGCTAQAQASIRPVEELKIVVDQITNVNCKDTDPNNDDGAIEVHATGGTSNYTYAWTWTGGSSNQQNISGLSPGTDYQVTVTDANNCTATSESIPITEPALALSATVTIVKPSCAPGSDDGSITVNVASGSGTAPYQYSKDGGFSYQDSNILEDLAVGSYSIRVKDKNDCTFDLKQQLTAPQSIVLTVAPQSPAILQCAEGMATFAITVTQSEAGKALQYQVNSGLWIDMTNTATVDLPVGTFDINVRYKDTQYNNCISTVSVKVQPVDPLKLNPPTVTQEVSCFNGSDGEIKVTKTGGAAGNTVTFHITGPNGYQDSNTTGIFSGLKAGEYIITMTNANGCTSSPAEQRITLAAPVDIIIDEPIVTGEACGADGKIVVTATGGTGTLTYSISPNAGTQLPAGTFTGLPAGSYEVTVTDSKGCSKATGSLTIGTKPQAIDFTAEPDNKSALLCDGQTTTIRVTVSSSETGRTLRYRLGSGAWQDESYFDDITPGVYQVWVAYTETENCPAGPVSVTVNDATKIQFDLALTHNTCNGGSEGKITITLNQGDAPVTYSLDGTNFQSESVFENLPGGPYTVIAKDDNGCTVSQKTALVDPAAVTVASKSSTDVTCITNGVSNGTITVVATGGTGAIQYTLTPNDDPSWKDNGTFLDLSAGDHTVYIRDANNCPNPPLEVSFTIASKELKAEVKLEDVVNIDCTGNDLGSAIVTATGGTLPYQYSWSNGATSSKADNLTAGNYTVTVTDGAGCKVENIPVSISAPQKPVLNLVKKNDITCSDLLDGYIEVAVLGDDSTQGYTYTINGQQNQPANSPVFSGLPEGTYSIVVTDKNGCQATTDPTPISIRKPSPITGSFVVVEPLTCFGDADGELRFDAAGGGVNGATPTYSYKWSNGSQTNTATNLSTGSHLVDVGVVTMNNGNSVMTCVTRFSYTLTQPDELTVTPGHTDVGCNGGDNGTISLDITGGTQPYDVTWTAPGGYSSTDKDITGLAPNTYTYTVSDANGCGSVTGQVVISEPDPITNISLAVGAVACAGESTTLTVSATGDTNEELAYSLDGVNWQKLNEFQVSVGNHDVYVGYWISDTQAKCVQPPHSVSVSGRAEIVIDKIEVADPVLPCNQTSTTVTITASITGGGNLSNLRYNMGNGWQTSNQFLLPANAAGYPVCIQYADESHCPVCIDTTVQIKTNVSIDITSVDYTALLDCPESTDGTITIHATGDGSTLEYSIGGAYLENDGRFTGLSKGKYQVSVRYQGETCAQSYGEVEIKAPATINITNVAVGTVTCAGDLPTTIKVTATGDPNKTIQYSMDGGTTWPLSGTSGQEVTFIGVLAGPYNVMARYQSTSNPQNCGIVLGASGTIATPPAEITINGINVDPMCAGQANTVIHILATGQTTDGYSMEYGVNDGTTTTWYPTPDITLPAGTYGITVRYRNYGCETASEQVIITALAAINNITTTVLGSPLPCGDPTAKATVTITFDPIAGNPSMKYTVFDGTNTQTNATGVFELPVGSYTACVEYADNNACPQCATNPVIISSNGPIPQVTLTTINAVTKDTLNCETLNTTLLVDPHNDDYRYSLNGGQTMTWAQLENQPVVSGTWAVKVWDVTDATCVQTSNTVTIVQGKKIVINDNNVVITQPLCPNETGSVTVTLTGYGQEKLVYILRPQSGPDITNNDGRFASLAGGTYTLIVKYAKPVFSECEGIYSKDIVISPSPADISNIVLTTGVPELTCAGSTTTLKASAYGTQQLEFRLDGGDWKSVAGKNEYTFTNVGGGSHTVDIRYAGSGTNCMESASITIKEWAPIVMDVDVASLILACGQPNTTITLQVTQKETGKALDFSIDGGKTWFSNGTSDTYTFTVAEGNYTPAARYRDNPSCMLFGSDIRIDKDINLTINVTVSPSLTLNCASDKAVITVVASGDARKTLQFTLDGNNWIDGTGTTGTETHTFTDLPAGKYDKIAVRYKDQPDCPKTNPAITITAPDKIQILSVTPASPINLACNSDMATITINAKGSESMEYSIRDGEWQSGNIFNDVAGGTYLAKVRYGNGGKCEVTASQAIVVNQPAAITFKEVKVGGQVYTTPVELACNGDLTTIEIVATGDQTRTLEYSINGIDYLPTALFSSITPGTYYPSVRYRSPDAACTVDWGTEVEITAPDPVTANIYAEYSQLACDGSQKTRIIFDINGSDANRILEYSIDGGAWVTDTAMLQKVGVGQHTATVRYQGYGCPVSAVITITSDGTIQGVDLSADKLDLNCGEKTTLRVTVFISDQDKTLQYRLRDGSGKVTAWQTSNEFALRPGGTYVAEVSYTDDVSCIQYSSPLTITQPASIDITDVYVGTTALACNGDMTDIIVTADGHGQALKYILTPEGSTPIENTNGIFNVGAGKYNLSVIYENTGYCPSEYPTIEITEPAAIKYLGVTGPTAVDCAGDKALITVNVTHDSNRQVEYSKDGVTWQDDKVLQLGIGSYEKIQVRYKNPNAACAVLYGQTVTITGPAPIIIDHIGLDKNMVDCSDATDQATITVTAKGTGLVYSFDGGLTYQTDNFKKVGSGTYYICVAYGNVIDYTCPVCNSDPVVVNSNSNIVIVNTAITGAIQCNGGTTGLTVTVSGDDVIEVSLDGQNWFETTGGSYTFSDLTAGQYYVSARYVNETACVKVSGAINITEPDPVGLSLVAYTDVRGCKGETPGTAIIEGMGGSGSYEYSLDNGVFTPMSQNPFTITGLDLGNHTITLRDTEGCRVPDEDKIQLSIMNPDSMIISYDIVNIRCFGEANGRLTLKVKNGHAPYGVIVFNDLGQIIRTGYLANTSDELKFDNLASGFYWVRVTDANSCEQLIRVQILQPAGPLEIDYIGYNICPLNEYGRIQPQTYGGWPDYVSYWYSRKSDTDDYAPMYPDGNGNATGGKVPVLYQIEAGQYQIVVKDQALCADTTWVNIVKLEDYSATTRPHGVRCSSPNSGSVKIVNPQGGNGGPYWFRVRDANTTLPVPGFEMYQYYPNDSIYGLAQGNYFIDMKDEIDVIYPEQYACNPYVIPVTIGTENGIIIDHIDITDPNCFYSNDGKINGVTISGTTAAPLEYKLKYWNGAEIGWQSTAVFDTISTGSYTLYVREKVGLGDGCEAEQDFTVDNPAKIEIKITDLVAPNCENNPKGYIDFKVWGGTGVLEVTYNGESHPYIIDQDTLKFHVEPSKGGWTIIEATDANGCVDTVMRKMPYATDLVFDKVRIVPNKCPDDKNAQIKAIASDHGVSTHTSFTYSLYTGVATILDNRVGQPITPANLTDTASFEGLANGTYVLSMQADGNGCFTNDSVVTIINTNNIELTNFTVVNDCPARVIFTIVGDPSNTSYSYSIDAGQPVPLTNVDNGVAEDVVILGLVPGTHTLIIYYGECEHKETFTIQSKVKPTVTPHAVTGCYGEANGSIEITMPDNSGVPYKYWYNELSADNYTSFATSLKTTITNLKAGNYKVVVQQFGGCYSDTIKVTVDDAPRMNIGFVETVPITCKGQYGEGDIAISDGIGPYTASVVPQNEGGYPSYATPPVINGLHLSNVTGGQYRIAIVDNGTGCKDTLELDIYAPRVVEILVTQPTITCATSPTQSITVTVEVTKPTSGTFVYTMNGGIPMISSSTTQTYDLPTGTYRFEVREQSTSCLADTSIAVKIPQPMILSLPVTKVDHGNCHFTADIAVNITGGTAPYTIKMNNAPAQTLVEGLPDGTYKFEVWDANNCYVEKTVTVVLPTAITVAATIRNVQCNQDGKGSIVVTPATYSYLWEDGSTDNTLYDLNAGDYKVNISNGSGCSIDTVFTVKASYTIDVAIVPDGEDTHIFCPGTDVVLNGLVVINGTPISSTTSDAFANWILPNGDTKEYLTNNPLILTATNGTIQLTASSGGCTSSATFDMETKPTPTLAFATDTVYIPKDEVYTLKMSASDYASYMWTSTPDANYAQGLPAPPADVTLASPDAPYTLTLTLTGDNGCSVSDAIYVSRALDFFIPNAFTPNDDGNHDTWKFRNIEQYIDYYDIQVAVFNRGGFQVYSAKGYNNSSVVWDGRRNGNDLPIGTYYYVVKLVPKSPTGKSHTFNGSVTIIR